MPPPIKNAADLEKRKRLRENICYRTTYPALVLEKENLITDGTYKWISEINWIIRNMGDPWYELILRGRIL